MARLGRSYTSTLITRSPAGAPVAVQSGMASAGGSASGAARKVAAVGAVCSAGVAAAGAETGVLIVPVAAPVVVTRAAHAAAFRYRTQTPQTWIDLGSPQLLTATAESGAAAAGVTASAIAVKVAKVSAACPAGFSASGAEAPTAAATAAVQPLVVVRAAHVAAVRYRTQPSPVWIDLGSPQLLSGNPDAGVCAVGVTASGTARKVAAVGAVCSAGAFASGAVGSTVIAAVAATCSAGTSTAGAARKRAAVAAVTTAAVAASGGAVALQASRAVTATCTAGLSTRAATTRRATVTGASTVGVTCQGGAGKRVAATGSAYAGASACGTVRGPLKRRPGVHCAGVQRGPTFTSSATRPGYLVGV